MSPDADSQIDLSVSCRICGVSLERRESMIAEAAYFRAEARGFEPGAEIEDWLEAELEVEQRLAEHEADCASHDDGTD